MRRLTWRFWWTALVLLTLARLGFVAWQWPRVSAVNGLWPVMWGGLRFDLVILGTELFLIVHMFMGFLASTQVQIEAAGLFLGGEYTMVFWIFVVVLGIIIPAVLDLMELRGKHIPALIPGVLVLLGSFMFRFIFVFAGQVSRWLY